MGIITEDMRAVVNGQRLGFIATVCPDGTPNLSPKGTTLVWDADHLVFADICSPTTMENLAHNPAIEINVVDPIRRKGYRFKGQARIVTQSDELTALIAWYRQQGSSSKIRAVVIVEVLRAAPLISPAYDGGASEDEVSQRWDTYYRSLREGRGENHPSGEINSVS
jgi:predicted pyridoxine 5'-phosphate oxidase superfamily flavin-nucleotide-binding protein